jgi:hypothetical protein
MKLLRAMRRSGCSSSMVAKTARSIVLDRWRRAAESA